MSIATVTITNLDVTSQGVVSLLATPASTRWAALAVRLSGLSPATEYLFTARIHDGSANFDYEQVSVFTAAGQTTLAFTSGQFRVGTGETLSLLITGGASDTEIDGTVLVQAGTMDEVSGVAANASTAATQSTAAKEAAESNRTITISNNGGVI